ncbi:MAG: hypothetical protein KGH98_01635 [Candidatus Micrarchaeota archaeon]|nr:hypothetical protein [Candidatus Micrarchaeota archaeon]
MDGASDPQTGHTASGRKLIAAIIVVAAVVGVTMVLLILGNSEGATGQTSQSGQLSSSVAQQKLEQYATIAKTAKDYEVDYNVSLLGQQKPSLTLRQYVLNNSTKKETLSANALGNATLYDINGTVTICGGSANATSCYKSNYTVSHITMESLLNVNFSSPNLQANYLGAESFAGRSCDAFLIMSNSKGSSLLSTFIASLGIGEYGQLNTSQGGSYSLFACMDQKYGTPLKVVMNYTYYSVILNQNETTPVVDMTATGFNTSVSQSQFVLPKQLQNLTVAQNGCLMPGYFSCLNSSMSANGIITVQIEQSSQSQINITAAGCNENGTIANMRPISPQKAVPAYGNLTLSAQCYALGGALYTAAKGGTFHGYVLVNYTDISTGFPHTAVGSVTESTG